MPKMAALAARFPDRELALRRLHAQDADFRGICDDYEEALTALCYWQGKQDAARAEEYRQLAEELEAEILAALDCSLAAVPTLTTDEPAGAGSDPGARRHGYDNRRTTDGTAKTARRLRAMRGRGICERARLGHRGLRLGGPGGGAGGGQAEHPLHHGRRHRLHAAVDLPPRADGRRDAQHRSHRRRGRTLHRLLCRAELHRRSQRLLHRHAPAPHRHDPAAAARAARPTCGPAPRRSPSSCTTSATTPASSARTTSATTPMRCRPRTASRSSGATSTTSTRCRG